MQILVEKGGAVDEFYRSPLHSKA